MRSLGESTYFLKTVYEPLKEIMGDKKYEIGKDPIRGFIVHTNRIDGELLESVDDLLNDEFGNKFRKSHYNHNMEISWRDIIKYAECVTPMDMYEVSPETTSIKPNQFGAEYRTTDYCSDGTWVYPLPKLETTDCGGWNTCVFAEANTELLELHLPALLEWYGLCNVKRLRIYAPNVTLLTSAWNTQNEEFFITADNITTFAHDCRWNKLKHVDFGLPKLSNGDGAFHSAQLDKESCLLLLNSLPEHTTGTHKFMLGAHIDLQSDDEVLAAIADAEDKGWTVTVQWNGTPTAQTTSTFGLRKPSIYAKLSEIERPDGSKEQNLDWGHYVTNPEDYQEFSSLEDAYEHFNLPNNTEN